MPPAVKASASAKEEPAPIIVLQPSEDTDHAAAEQELRIARTKADAHLYEQALTGLRDLVSRHSKTPEALDAYFLMASIQEQQDQFDDAMATYLEIGDRFKDHARAPEALYRVAELIRHSRRPGKEREAERRFTMVATQYTSTVWAARALLARALLEERHQAHEWDVDLKRSVSSALVTYRTVAVGYRGTAEAAVALKKLAEGYEELKRYDLAASAWSDLAGSAPNASSEAWYHAGEIYRRHLQDESRARMAYERVSNSSPFYAKAQKLLEALAATAR